MQIVTNLEHETSQKKRGGVSENIRRSTPKTSSENNLPCCRIDLVQRTPHGVMLPLREIFDAPQL